MDRGTVREFHENKPQPLYLDRLLDQVASRKLTDEERAAATRQLAKTLIAHALEADRRTKQR
jgi:hypothetical protein